MTLATVGLRPGATDAAYPTRPVRFVVPSAAAGPTDVMARMIPPGLNFRFGHPVPIINRAGGNGTSPIITAEKRWFDLPDVPTTRKQLSGRPGCPGLFS
jgi:hypothetical protein